MSKNKDYVLSLWELYLKLGASNNVMPVEGVVFEYNNTQYKLTGSFTPINLTMGLAKYG